MDDLKERIAFSTTVEECWSTVATVCAELHFTEIEMYFDEQYFRSKPVVSIEACDWSLTTPLGERGYLRLQRPNLVKPPQIAMAVIDTLTESLSRRERIFVVTESGLPKRRLAEPHGIMSAVRTALASHGDGHRA